MAALIVIIVVVVFALIVAARSIRVIPQARAGVVERLGRYSRTLEPGLTIVTPFIDRVRPLVDLREQVVNFAPQSVITEDNVVVSIETVLYFTITDPRSATYEIASPLQAIEQLTVTTLRNVIGGLTLEDTLTSRENVNAQLRTVLDEATGKWGIRINRVEIKSVDPPPDIKTAMEKQMRAERDRRAAILTAEGDKQSQILTAEGAKQAAVLNAEGAKQAAVLQAEGERQAAILRAEGDAKAIDTVFRAIHEGKPDRELLSYEYLKMLPELAEGDANKVFVVPSEFAEAFGGIGEALSRRAKEISPPQRPPDADGGAGSSARGRQATVFDSLTEKLQGTLADVRNRGALSEQDVDAALRTIRLALLEADVNLKVVRQFTTALRERCLGADVVGALNPGQQVVKIVAEELTSLMGGEEDGAAAAIATSPTPPTVILMAGLQGSGKTTASAKLARHLREERKAEVALAACDVYRPAAVEQLVKLGAQAGAEVYEQGTERDPVDVATWALQRARAEHRDVLIVDTSGRLHVDEAMMDELARMRAALEPHAVLLVVDAMTGQDAAGVAESFAEAVDFDAAVITKLDGDARGGAALSVKALTGRPIAFASTGERLEQFERFHPDRMAQRILGMGDVMSLIEKAESQFESEQARELERKLRRNEFGFDDFLGQLQTIRRMGPLTSLLGMIPGMDAQLKGLRVDERELDRIEAIVRSMTLEERRRPELIKGSRRLRIARGSGTTVQQVNALVKQFGQMRRLMRDVGRGKMPDLGALMRGAR